MKTFPKIYGFNKTSEAGFNLFACSIFLSGCNLRCPFCMNSKLVFQDKTLKTYDIEDIKKYVEETKCEWVMISGGEITVTPQEQLEVLMNEIISWGCKIGISSNGTNPDSLKKILKLVNYVALDFKSPDALVYEHIDVLNKDKSFANLLMSKSLLVNEKVNRKDFDYEIRTTLYPAFVWKDAIMAIGGYIMQDETWVLQQYRQAKNMLKHENAMSYSPYSYDAIQKLLDIAKKYSKNVSVRYV